MAKLAATLGCLLFIAALAGCGGDDGSSSAPATTVAPSVELPVEVEVVSDVPVTSSSTADVYAPIAGGPWPVVLLLHGLPPGMDPPATMRRDLAPLAEAVAEQGAVVVNASYKAVTPEQAVGDTTCALQVAAEVASDYGGDPDRLVAVGHSAGALPALAYGLDSPLLTTPFTDCAADADAAEVVPDAVVTVAGGFDIRLVASLTPAVAWRSATADVLDGLDPMVLIANGGNPTLKVWIAPAPAGGVGLATAEGSVKVYDALVAAAYDATLLDPPLAAHDDLTRADSEDLQRSAAMVQAAVESVG